MRTFIQHSLPLPKEQLHLGHQCRQEKGLGFRVMSTVSRSLWRFQRRVAMLPTWTDRLGHTPNFREAALEQISFWQPTCVASVS